MRRGILPGVLAAAAMAGGLALPVPAGAAEQAHTKLRVKVFPGISNLALFAAQQQGAFARRGLEVEIQNTPNSRVLRDDLAKGAVDVAHAAVDNAVAMVELDKHDVIIVMGGDSGQNSLFVQPEVGSIADLRGKTVAVDAPNTAYALLLYKMLKVNGLQKGDYTVKPVGGTSLRLEAMRKDKALAASMLNPPFSVQAEREGLRSLGDAVRTVGPYQGPGLFVMRSWARAHGDTLVRYLQANIEGLRWALDPANRTAMAALVAERLKLPADVATRCLEIVSDPATGFAKDARFDLEGFKNTLKLRAELEGQWGGTPPPAEKYIDLSYFERAVAGL